MFRTQAELCQEATLHGFLTVGWKHCLPLVRAMSVEPAAWADSVCNARPSAGILTAHLKRFEFSKFMVPLLKYKPLCVQETYGPLHVALWKLGSRN